MKIIERLNILIKEKNIPIVRISQKSGLSRQHIAKILKKETNAGIETLQLICKACNTSFEDLLHNINNNNELKPYQTDFVNYIKTMTETECLEAKSFIETLRNFKEPKDII